MRNYFHFILCLSVLASVLTACKKDTLLTDSSAVLSFSTDTVLFDTVFTTIGSTTGYLKLYNTYDKKIKISSIYLAGGASSPFRINVDGSPGIVFIDIEIPANDSLYIFVEVTVDPTTGNLPFIVNDSIVFSTNGNTQDVNLVAWGQDAYFHNGETIGTSTWLSDKPHVIYNSILVDSLTTLTLDPGVMVHSHGYAGIFVKGTLDVNGTVDDPVIFQGDRLESFYDDVPSQWLGIFLLRGSSSNSIQHAIIKNAFYGVSVGSNDNPDLNSFTWSNAPDATISHTIIKNMTYIGIFGFLSDIDVSNTLVYNCGQHNAHLAFGGNYVFNHVTMSNYGYNAIDHSDPVLELGNFAESQQGHFSADLDATFTNCIIDGSLDDEIGFDNDQTGGFAYLFENCVLKTKFNTTTSNYVSVLKNEFPYYVEAVEEDYHLATNSPCIDAGKVTSISDDLDGISRDPSPDIGCYELN